MNTKLGEVIRKARGDLSLRDFSEKTGISHTQIDVLEKGYDPRTTKPARPTVDTLSKISSGSGIPIGVLLSAAAEDSASIEENQYVAGIISHSREARNMSIADISKKTGLSEELICQYETGTITQKKAEDLIKIADALEIMKQELIGWTQEEYNEYQTKEWEEENRITIAANRGGKNSTKPISKEGQKLLDAYMKFIEENYPDEE